MHAGLARGRQRLQSTGVCVLLTAASFIFQLAIANEQHVETIRKRVRHTRWPNKHLLPVQQCTPTTTMKRHIQVGMRSSDFMDSSTATTN